ncbi:fatty acid-binding protein-like [Ptychodera flava]|uniref:fatty acid-binding protein-like n=1 Tax=Ptychodera flava TaxID=63121 RepID=UPI003969FD8E
MAFQGKWLHFKDDNVDAFLDAVGAAERGKQIVRETHPELEIGRDGEYFTAKLVFPGVSDIETKFKEGEEFDHPSSIVDASKTRRAVATKLSDNKFVIKTVSGQPDMTETREIVGDELVTTLEVGEAVCKRYFKRL